MQPLIRIEYLAAALEKSTDAAQRAALEALKPQVLTLGALEVMTPERCAANRIQAGEKPRRTRAPASIQSASDKAAEDIHQMLLRVCERAASASEILFVLERQLGFDIDFNRPLLRYIDLPANLVLSEALLASKDALREQLLKFLATWPGKDVDDQEGLW